MYSPSPPAPMAAATVAVPTPITVATRIARHDLRQRQRQLHHHQQLPRCHPHRGAGFDDRAIDRRKPGDRRTNDRQQRVEGQRHQRRAGPDPADERQRQQEAEREPGWESSGRCWRRPRMNRPARGRRAAMTPAGQTDRHRNRCRNADQQDMLLQEAHAARPRAICQNRITGITQPGSAAGCR